jgi:hypothetical protein
MEKKIEIVNNWNLKDIFNELERGNIKIPRFQRGYVWERSKIAKLLNSIYKQYPIGSFFVWMASLDYKNFCREITELNLPIQPESNKYSFILDGQQRITSLYVALKGKTLNGTDFSAICFNLEKKEFQIPRLKNEKHNIPAWKLFHTTAYGDVFAEYMSIDRDKANTWRECQEVFSNYPISLIKTLDMDLEQVVTIFERINQGGKRLSLFDLVHASSWSPDFDLREKIKKFNDEHNVKYFGGLENEVFIQSLALNAFDDCLNRHQLNLTADICNNLWSKTIECLRLSIDYVKTFGVRFINFIPYNSFLPVIQYYFFKSGFNGIKSEHGKFIEDWFWTATFSQRYSSSSLTLMKDDADWIYKLSQGTINENTFNVSLTTKELVKVRMQNISVIKNGVLCLMALENPKDFNNGQPVILDRTNVSRSNSKENHHFFPFSLRAQFNTDNNGINSLLNFALISGRLNREISNDLPSVYFKNYELLNSNIEEHLNSHFINNEALEAVKNDNFQLFIQKRGEVILQKIQEKTRVSGFTDPETEIEESNIEFEEELIEEENNND